MTRILDVWAGEKKIGELRLSDGVYSWHPKRALAALRSPAEIAVAQALFSLQESHGLGRRRVSDCLFPPFAERVPSKRRGDHKAMYEELGLSEDADDFSFLEASGGKLVTSSITLRKHEPRGL